MQPYRVRQGCLPPIARHEVVRSERGSGRNVQDVEASGPQRGGVTPSEVLRPRMDVHEVVRRGFEVREDGRRS